MQTNESFVLEAAATGWQLHLHELEWSQGGSRRQLRIDAIREEHSAPAQRSRSNTQTLSDIQRLFGSLEGRSTASAGVGDVEREEDDAAPPDDKEDQENFSDYADIFLTCQMIFWQTLVT